MPKKPTPEQCAEKDAKRRKALMTGSMRHVRTLHESHVDPETGAGVVVVEWRPSGDKSILEAYFFKRNQTNRYAWMEELTSNHQRVRVAERLRELQAEEAAAKVAPHDLTPGEVLREDWGASMNRPNFLKVLSVPHPRKVEVIRLRDRLVSGDRQVGTVVPIEPHEPASDPFICDVSMQTGSAQLKLGSLSRTRRWDGKPASITSD